MKRKIEEQLFAWKNKTADRLPLIVNGARQVGKTYILRKFGESNENDHPASHHRMAHKRTVQMIPTLRFSGVGISNHFLPGSCSYATI